MLKTWSPESAKPIKGIVKANSNGRAGRDGSKLDGNEVDGNEVNNNEVRDDKVGKKVQKTSKSKNLFKSKKMVGSDFFTPEARLAFIKLR